MFYECEESNIASYADDTTRYSCAKDTQAVISDKLKKNKQSLTNFFTGSSIIHLKANLGKCHLLLSFKTSIDVSITDASLKSSTKETYFES